MTKLCIDCTHYRAPMDGLSVRGWATCVRYRFQPSPVDGSAGAPRFCEAVRSDASACGPDGVAFEAAKVAA